MISALNTLFSHSALKPCFPLSTVLCLALCSSLCFGQTNTTQNAEPESRWYEVEVIVFARSQDPLTASEVWPVDLDLRYPNNWVELKGLPEPTPPVHSEAAQLADTDSENFSDSTEVETLDEEQNEILEFDPLRDIAYHVLADEELRLKDEARHIRRRNQILFHQAWRQPFIRNDEETPAILIFGGEQVGDHHQLEGSIQLNYRRWLHVETNFWLSWLTRNYGQETENWPELPTAPNQSAVNFPNRLQVVDDTELNPTMSGFDASTNIQKNQPLDSNRDASGFRWSNDDDWQYQPLTSTYDSILAKPYIPEHIVQMKESRKVNRSGDIHYIDHPQMGVLVLFTRYELPEQEDPDAKLRQQLDDALGIPF